MWKSCEEYVKKHVKKKHVKYYSRYSHACEIFRKHVKIILKLFLYMWIFFHTCETIFPWMWNSSVHVFSHVWNNFIVYVKCFHSCETIFLRACEIFSHVKQFCPACEIFYTCEPILLCMWNFSMQVNFMFHMRKFFHTWETVQSCMWIFTSMLTLL